MISFFDESLYSCLYVIEKLFSSLALISRK